MKLSDIKYFYFLGIGGIGMSALARYFRSQGKHVAGYDKTRTKLTDELETEGIRVHFEENAEWARSQLSDIKSQVLVVYTPAVPKEHKELVYFQQNGFAIKKRSEVLGMVTQDHYTIAVAGTHGKTTTSSLIAHILRSSGIDCTAFLGGITQNYNTNLLLSRTFDRNTVIVTEADEYDRSFLTLHPDVAVITSVDADHLDIYGDAESMRSSYADFAKQVKKGGKLILKKDVPGQLSLKAPFISYSQDEGTDYFAENISVRDGAFRYSIQTPSGEIKDITLGVPGRHNIENSVAATAAAQVAGISNEKIRAALASFKGVKRRFEYHIREKNRVMIDDYAHHPAELRACITAVRELYPHKRILGVFQPHLYSRTRDFADAFARSLELLDELILLDIYPAREQPIPGVSSQVLLDKVRLDCKQLCSKLGLTGAVTASKAEVILTLGAGDIDMLVEPLANELLKKNK